MAKLAPTSIKYVIRAYLKAKGIVEKPDVIGAIFGQTEGLLGSALDLRELQRTGRIGRIEVNVKSVHGKSEGEIIIPSSLDSAETALIAATLETIERVGPCDAEIELRGIEDARLVKRDYVIERAKEILQKHLSATSPDISEVSERIKEAVKTHEITTYQGLPAGPGISENDEIVIVEGRADVINLLKNGISNVIAIEGTSVPSAIHGLTSEKTTTIFMDGDRGGELIVKELLQKADVDFVCFAPSGKEVEEMTKKEIYKSLRSRMTVEQFLKEGRPGADKRQAVIGEGGEEAVSEEEKEGQPIKREKVNLEPAMAETFRSTLEDLVGSRAACIFDEKMDLLGKVPVSELVNALKTIESPFAIIFDGTIDNKLAMLAKKKSVKYLVGMEKDADGRGITLVDKHDLDM